MKGQAQAGKRITNYQGQFLFLKYAYQIVSLKKKRIMAWKLFMKHKCSTGFEKIIRIYNTFQINI